MSRSLLRATIYSLSGLGALVIFVTFSPFVEWAGRRLAGPWRDPPGEVLIVLGAGVLGDGVLTYSSYVRSHYAIRAYREGTFRSVVLSGGGGDYRTEAESMAGFLEGHGVPRTAIILESKSHNTYQNATYAMPLLRPLPGRTVLMTSDYHMFRARRVFQKQGINVEPRPIPDVIKRGSSWPGRWWAFLDLTGESVRILYYYWKGWI
jgi:uncharacterized SAM-binding protein YcdF (DUF218 family)